MSTNEEALTARIASLEKSLREINDERAILDVLYRYGHSIDYGLEEQFLDCFTDDARWYMVPQTPALVAAQNAAGRTEVDFKGQLALRRFISSHTRAPAHLHKHLLMEPRIQLHGDSADVASYYVRIDASKQSTGSFVRSFGRYVDKLARCPDGKWRFTERRCDADTFTGVG